MTKFLRTVTTILLAVISIACGRIMEEEPLPEGHSLPDGVPVMLKIDFGSSEMIKLDIGTKAEASESDESRVHDLYVMIFDNKTLVDGSPKKIYGRYFSYEHLAPDLSSMNANTNEGWWVENKTLSGVSPAVAQTAGAVKVSTVTCSNALLVVLANVTNAVSSMSNDPNLDDIAYLNGLTSFQELKETKITLEQDVVNRKDLFLMMGTLGKIGPSDESNATLNTSDMIWGELPKSYDLDYKVSLKPLDAKVKFMVRTNRDNIDKEDAVYWTVCSTPDKCFLFPDGTVPGDAVFFDSETSYFEGTEPSEDSGYSDWYVFTFYVLENQQTKKKHATSYHDREKQIKTDSGNSGYEWWTRDGGGDKEYHSGNYVNNGKWEYANDLATYVKFDMVLTLNSTGIFAATGETVNNALTTDTIFSVHLGDFGSSGSLVENAFDDYSTLRGCYYTYKITIDNSGSVYAEVENDNERQPGQEGYLLLTNDEIVNADAHYEYHSVSFEYSEDWDPSVFSWYVKTPFGQGEPKKTTEIIGGRTYPLYNADGLDYKWVMFGVNNPDSEDPSKYSDNRLKYPGISKYKPAWKPSSGEERPELLDINQLIEYLFDQKVRKENSEPNDFLSNTIKVTIFIDEYYYEKNPLDPDAEADPDLWRQFVNAAPREMHILSDARKSRDKKSDVILSSHSIIQQSIQSIYNTYSPGLRSLWGTEHKDEIKEKVPEGWHYWPASGCGYQERKGSDNDAGRENGRLNTAYIWNVATNAGVEQSGKEWDTYMDFSVNNNTPELKSGYQGMAFSCMTRNRDNNGNGVIDRDEVRWYMASTRQLIGMWVGNESLSLSARLYQPADGQWRAHVVSSTNKLVCWSEEGAGATPIDRDWAGSSSVYATWNSEDEAAAGESVRCLRNIGTYDDASEVKDISYAPYTKEVDKYFTIETEGSGLDATTTFYFDRLDTKSIREYSEGELPYHPQTSVNNRVYVKMTAQSQASQVDAFSPTLSADINPIITASGSNSYCPAGWRLPNQTEYVLMSLYMPQDYFIQDAEGNNYASDVYMPSRTYYDRGVHGSLRQESGPWSSEKNKVIFGYSTGTKKTFCTGGKNDHNITRTRCVRDDKMTGVISGDLLVNDKVLYPEDWTRIIFNFSSVASAFSYASLKLCYNSHNGNYRELDLPIDKMPNGLQFRDTLTTIIPSLATLGLDASDFPHPMTLQAQVRNLAGQTETKNVNLTMNHPLAGRVSLDFPSVSNETNGMPIRVKMSVGGHSAKLSSATLEWKESSQASWNSYNITGFDTDFDRSYTEDIYIKQLFDAAENTDFSEKAFIGKRYNYRLTVTASDGSTETSPIRSMEVVRYYYTPNPVPDGGWTSNSQCNKKWGGDDSAAERYKSSNKGDKIENLDFNSGDIIEADIDMSNCVYVYIDGNAANDMGKDNIFGFSSDNVANITNSIIWYYPSVQNLVAPPGDTGWTKMRIHAGKWAALEPQGVVTQMNLILDKDGIIRDGARFTGNPGDWNSRVKGTLTGASTIYVGAQEGTHLSRATYNYVRVIRDREM